MLADLVMKNRSYRRFDESVPIEPDTLKELVALARFSASGGNLQPLKFLLSCTPEMNAKIFPCTLWAGALKDWPGPAEGERPTAYIVILGDTDIRKGSGVDYSIAAQSMLLGATEKGLGGCMIGSLKRDELRAALNIPERFEILLVVALGKPNETIVLEDLAPEGDTRYYRDGEDSHHVPKRTLDELIVEF